MQLASGDQEVNMYGITANCSKGASLLYPLLFNRPSGSGNGAMNGLWYELHLKGLAERSRAEQKQGIGL